MKNKILIALLSLITTYSIAQVKMDNNLQFTGAMIADRTITGVTNLYIEQRIILDGKTFIENRNGNSILIGETQNTTLTGDNNIFIGLQAGKFTSTGQSNIFIGKQTGIGNFTSSGSIGIGVGAAASNKGDYNIMIGRDAGYSSNMATGLAFLGNAAGKSNIISFNNVAIGSNAGFPSIMSGANYNTIIGPSLNKVPVKGTFIGVFNDLNTNLITTVTAIGHEAKGAIDNTIVLGGSIDQISVGINTPTPRCALDINATGSILIPVGTNTQRPTAVQGMIRYNTTTNKMEVYNGTTWKNFNY